jgi:hypothetical protein
MDDKLVEAFVERRSRCSAIVLNYGNVWQAARELSVRGWDVNIRIHQGSVFIEAQRGDSAFTADVENGDTLMLNGYDDFEYMDGLSFRKQWERENRQ